MKKKPLALLLGLTLCLPCPWQWRLMTRRHRGGQRCR